MKEEGGGGGDCASNWCCQGMIRAFCSLRAEWITPFLPVAQLPALTVNSGRKQEESLEEVEEGPGHCC